MTDVTPDDLKRVHDRINDNGHRISKLNDALNSLVVQVARIATHLENYNQPCHYHTELAKAVDQHISNETSQKNMWRDSVIKSLVNVIQMAIVGLIVYWFTSH